MKKIIALITSFLLLGSMLCGCGCTDGKVDVIEASPSPVMTSDISPIPTPDMENGMIEDEDGKLDNQEQEKDNKGSASDKNNMLEDDMLLSPAPTGSPMP